MYSQQDRPLKQRTLKLRVQHTQRECDICINVQNLMHKPFKNTLALLFSFTEIGTETNFPQFIVQPTVFNVGVLMCAPCRLHLCEVNYAKITIHAEAASQQQEVEFA